jgi:hypothetical protein
MFYKIDEKIIKEVNRRLEESPSFELGGFSVNCGSYEFSVNEPPQIDMRKGRAWAKFWIDPVKFVKNYGLDKQQLIKANKLVKDNQQKILEFWKEHYVKTKNQNPIK